MPPRSAADFAVFAASLDAPLALEALEFAEEAEDEVEEGVEEPQALNASAVTAKPATMEERIAMRTVFSFLKAKQEWRAILGLENARSDDRAKLNHKGDQLRLGETEVNNE